MTEPTRIGLVAIGYADGYPRLATTGTPVAVDGTITCVVGRVSMDVLTIDLSNHPGSGIGCRVELWRRHVPVNEVARRAGTISCELLCNVKRVPIIYDK
ncbi:Alanine racemase, catabolic (plasmid) [Variovorax sp. SRS16]|nr:Alanine racemase, catabolic [Variovorax sp. SRS16]